MHPAVATAARRARRGHTLLRLAQLGLDLRARGARLVVEADPTARLLGRVTVLAAERGGALRLVLGPGAVVAPGMTVELAGAATGALVLGAGARIEQGLALRLVGGRVELGERATIGPHAALDVDGRFAMGRLTRLGAGNQVHAWRSVVLEELAVTAHACTLVDTDHAVDGSSRWFAEQHAAVGPVVVGANTVVSAGVRVLRGATIGRDSLVAANAVVARGDYPPSCLLAGAPATVRRSLVDRPIGSGGG